jgi:hypothetical protein
MRDCRVIFLVVLAVGLLAFGCGGDGDDKSQAQQTEPPEEMTEEDKIKASMTELIERLMEGDKTVLYEHEFSYFKDETSLSDYFKIPKVADYDYDTLSGIEYDSIAFYGDSAKVWAYVTYESKAGGEIRRKYGFWMYNYHGWWQKPYCSLARKEREYLEEKRLYEQNAEDETAEQTEGS